ncbi:MAG: competence protein ComEC family protein, partial [Prolixibacteraceae bacterium]|nr:competence protein ComEC family protein [Prolixibacteraceae bacterium]
MLENFLQKTPFFRILFAFIAGIVLVRISPFGNLLMIMVLAFLFLIVAIVVALQGGFRRNIFSGVLFSLFFLFLGAGVFVHSRQQPVFISAGYYCATLLEFPEEKPRSYRTEVLITAAGNKDSLVSCREHVIVYFAKSDEIAALQPGQQILFNRTPQTIANAQNPYAFDFRSYMARRGIYRQVYLSAGNCIMAGADPKIRARVISETVRGRLLNVYERSGLSGDEFAILSALTLGHKKSLDPEVKQVFSSSGAMHVLAVSGLHVGIVFVAFNLLFSSLKKSKVGRIVFVMGAIAFLWSYALITGLAPSVQRAALMFSLVQIGGALRRPANIYNTLFASAFILLFLNPMLLFEVGFQLSYAAVIGIVYFQPKITSLYAAPNKIVKYFWELFSVSLAAQIGTFAIACFYFKQFPVWFWISNFVVIPAALVFIIMGILILLTSPFPAVATFIAFVAGKLVHFLYQFLKIVDSLPGALYTGFNFTIWSLAMVIALILTIILFIESRRKFYLSVCMILCILFFSYSSVLRVQQGLQSELIAYQHD